HGDVLLRRGLHRARVSGLRVPLRRRRDRRAAQVRRRRAREAALRTRHPRPQVPLAKHEGLNRVAARRPQPLLAARRAPTWGRSRRSRHLNPAHRGRPRTARGSRRSGPSRAARTRAHPAAPEGAVMDVKVVLSTEEIRRGLKHYRRIAKQDLIRASETEDPDSFRRHAEARRAVYAHLSELAESKSAAEVVEEALREYQELPFVTGSPDA